MRLLFLTGSRPKELFGSRWRDFALTNMKAASWTKPSMTVKQKREHTVELSKEAVAVLRRMRAAVVDAAPDAYVFPSKKGNGPLTTVKKYWADVKKAAGLENARPYDLRKAFASRVLAAGSDIKTAMSLTGHNDVQVFMKHYAHLMPNKQGKALESVQWGKPRPCPRSNPQNNSR